MRFLFVLSYFGLALFGGPLVVLAAVPYREGAPALVVASPWSQGAEAVVSRAGGWLVGPDTFVLGVLAAGSDLDFAGRLRRSGAWLVLDGSRLFRLCGGAA